MDLNIYGTKLLWLAVFGVIAALFLRGGSEKHERVISEPRSYNPCCEFPCENEGVCMSRPDNRYYCDCTSTSHHGLNCHIPSWGAWLIKQLKPSPIATHSAVTSYRPIWAIINRIPILQKFIMKYIYLSRGDMIDSPNRFESDHSYITLDAYFNETYFGRTLPPVPLDCPTPMGVQGPKELPAVTEVWQKIFLRKTFKPEPHNVNLLFQYYAQHFTHQFFRTDHSKVGGKFTKGFTGVDVSNIYGLTEDIRIALRSRVDGKLKTQILNGEEFPPYVKDCPGIDMNYPPEAPIPEEAKFALGHAFFALLPGLFAYSTVWVREHNRVCVILKEEHPHWDDDRLYHTAKLIITGEVIKITIEDYVQALSQYHFRLTFDPELVHGSRFQFHNRINAEFLQLYHWHPLVADGLNVSGRYYSLGEMAFSNAPVFTHGLDNFVEALVNSRAGKITHQNHPALIEPIIAKAMVQSRAMRLPGLNEYRKRFSMAPYKSFEELTGETIVAEELRSLYGHVDAVEWYVGLIVEQPGKSVTPLTMVNIGGPWSVKGLISNPICSPKYWKPSTFGGDVGFDIIKSASIEKLFCQNLKSKCKDFKLSLYVPEGTP